MGQASNRTPSLTPTLTLARVHEQVAAPPPPPPPTPGRRRLANLAELVARCDGWRPPPPHAGIRLRLGARGEG